VKEHNEIDLDQKEMETALGAADWATAKQWYAVGGNSKTAAPFRTLKGFSTDAQAKMYDGCPGCPYKHYKQFYDYYGSFTYADDWAVAALDGTTLTFAAPASLTFDFGNAADAARKEAVKKGTAYMHAWMYAIREFEDAIDDCQTCTANCNLFSANDAGPVHAWDEGVAFYTGSLEGKAQGGTSSGKLAYRLAEKRCANFGTCSGEDKISGISNVNHELFKVGGLFPQGRDLLHEGKCGDVRAVVDDIVKIMTVPLVQGTLRYAWKTGQIGGVDNKLTDQSAKNSAEGSTFAAALLPLVHACDADQAKIVSDHMKFGAAVYSKTDGTFVSGTKPDTLAVKGALEKTYRCLGITCAHVGGLLSSSTGAPYAGMGTCPSTVAPAEKITGDAKHHVKVEVKAVGVVGDYDTPAKRAPLESKMATVAGVDVNAVTLTVKEATSRRRQLSAGSIIFSFVIVTADAAAATAVKNKVTTELADPTKASAALGVTVTEVMPVTVGSDTADDDDDGLSGGAIAGIIIGAVVGLLCIGGIIFFAMKSGKNVDPK
jgi:Notch-like protein